MGFIELIRLLARRLKYRRCEHQWKYWYAPRKSNGEIAPWRRKCEKCGKDEFMGDC